MPKALKRFDVRSEWAKTFLPKKWNFMQWNSNTKRFRAHMVNSIELKAFSWTFSIGPICYCLLANIINAFPGWFRFSRKQNRYDLCNRWIQKPLRTCTINTQSNQSYFVSNGKILKKKQFCIISKWTFCASKRNNSRSRHSQLNSVLMALQAIMGENKYKSLLRQHMVLRAMLFKI